MERLRCNKISGTVGLFKHSLADRTSSAVQYELFVMTLFRRDKLDVV